MTRYLYTVWFRSPMFPPGDQDHEWPACMLIDAPSESVAIEWGNHLASLYSSRSGEAFVSSDVEASSEEDLDLPIVLAGVDATDAEIGW